MHPTSTDFKTPKPGEERAVSKTRYPDEDTGYFAVARDAVSPVRLALSGLAAIIAGLIAAVLYLGSTDYTRPMWDAVLVRLFQLDPQARGGSFGPFWSGAAILGSFLALVGIALLASRIASGRTARNTVSTWRFRVSTTVVIVGLLQLGVVVTFCGDEPAAATLTNAFGLLLVVALVVGLTLLAVILGASGHRWPMKIVFGFIGFVHGCVHLLVPLTVMRMGTWRAVVSVVAIQLVFWFIGRGLVELRMRRALVVAWLVACVAMLVVPRLASGDHVTNVDTAQSLGLSVAAGVLGYLVAAFVLGWYFVVCMGINGHGNEAATIARVEDYKQFIRFHLDTKGKLTAYVIGLDKLNEDIFKLEATLVDKFTIASGES
jgi:hypothetical protein